MMSKCKFNKYTDLFNRAHMTRFAYSTCSYEVVTHLSIDRLIEV